MKKGIIKNYQALISHGQKKVREAALEIIQAGIQKANSGFGTYRLVRLTGDKLQVGDKEYDLSKIKHVYVVGAGKGSYPIVKALEEILGSRIDGGMVSVKKGEKRRLKRIAVIEAGHPIPDESSLAAGKRILEITKAAGQGDLVFAAITGGSSALAALPPKGSSAASPGR